MLKSFRFRPNLQALEDRAVPANIVWDGGGLTDNASEAANWTGDTLPGAGDTIVFDNSSANDCIIDTNVSVAGLVVQANYSGAIEIGAGKGLVVTSSAEIRGSEIGGGGTFTIGAGASLGWFGGGLSSSVVLGFNTTTTATGAGAATLSGQLENRGVFLVTDGALSFDGGRFINEGTFTLRRDSNLVGVGSGSEFTNRGFFRIETVPESGSIPTIEINLTNTSAGVIDAGVVGFVSKTGILRQDSETAILSTNASITVQNLDLAGGSVEGFGNILLGTPDDLGTASGTWTDGFFNHVGFAVKSNAVLVVDFSTGGPDFAFDQSRFVNSGIVTVQAHSTVKFHDSWLLNWGELRLDGENIFLSGRGNLLESFNVGQISKTGGPGSATISLNLTQSGQVNVDSGRLNLYGPTKSSGRYLVSGGAELWFGGFANHDWKLGLEIDGPGTVASNGIVKLDKGLSVRIPGQYILVGKSIGGEGDFSAFDFEWLAGNLNDKLHVTVNAGDHLTITDRPNLAPEDEPEKKGLVEKANLTVHGNAVYAGRGSLGLTGNSTVTIDGAQASFAIQSIEPINLTGMNDESKFVLKNQGTLSNQSPVKAEIQPEVINENGNIQPKTFKLPKFTNKAGRVQLNGNGGEIGTLRVGGGSLELGSWSLAVTGSATATGGLIDVQYGSLSVTGGLSIGAGATLAGYGNVTGDVTNAGTITPGAVGGVGQLLINGNYAQTATGTLAVDIGRDWYSGTYSDRLAITGTADVGGTVAVSLLPGSQSPQMGDRFRVLTYAASTGGTSPAFTGTEVGSIGLVADQSSPTALDLVAAVVLDNFDGQHLQWMPDSGGTPSSIQQVGGVLRLTGAPSPLTRATAWRMFTAVGDFSLSADFLQNGAAGGTWRHGLVLNFGGTAFRFTDGGNGQWRVEDISNPNSPVLLISGGTGVGLPGSWETLKARRVGNTLTFSVMRNGVETVVTSVTAPTTSYVTVGLTGYANNQPLDLTVDNFRLLSI